MNWVQGIGFHRVRTLGLEVERKPRQVAGKVDVAAFSSAMVSEKVLARFGANLHPSLDDMNAIAQTAAAFEPFRAKQFGHALERFYTALGHQLEALEPRQRGPAASTAVSTMRAFIGEVGAEPELMAAMATLSSMMEPRGELDVTPAKHAAAAKKAMLEVLGSIEGRDGATSMLHAHRHALEMIERASPALKASDRPALWKAATELISEALPRPGADFAMTGHLTALLFAAMKEHQDDPRAALAATRAAVFAEQAEAIRGAEAAIAALEDPLASALRGVLAANPAGPPQIAATVEQLAQRAAEGIDPEAGADLARLLSLVSDSPAIAAVLDHLVASFPLSAKANHASAVPFALIKAYAAQAGGAADALEAPVAEWSKLPRAAALRASVVLMKYLGDPVLAPALAAQLAVVAPSLARKEDLDRFADRFATAFPHLTGQLDATNASRVATALARRSAQLDPQVAARAGALARAVAEILNDVPLERLIEPLLQVTDAAQFGHDPLSALYDLLRAIAAQPRMKVEDRFSAAKAAIRTAAELGKLDRDPYQSDFPKILEDWRGALEDPTRLSFSPAAKKAAALRTKASLLSFLAVHPMLPPEVAVTAGMHLSPEQMQWLTDRISSTRSHAEVRALRDVVFAAVALDRLDLIEAFRTSTSEHSAQVAAAAVVAQHHLLKQLNVLPLDRIIEGLREGSDPGARIASERAAGALQAMNFAEVDGAVDPAGAKLIEGVQKELTSLLAFFPEGGQVHGVDTARFREPLLQAVRETITGEWPKAKFEGEIADRQLGGLSPRARAIWFEESISLLGRDPQGDAPEMIEAMQLARGIAGALPPEWNRELLAELQTAKREQVESLHGTKRGSDEHRRIASELGPLTSKIALIELKVTIERLVQQGTDSATALLELKPYLASAAGAARKLGGPGLTEAVRRIAEVAAALKKPGREGVYAVDESRIDACLTSFGGSCIHPVSGQNRASLVELLISPQYKMGRVMDGEKPIGRTIFRLLQVELPNGYQGYALRMDKPLLTTSWTSSPPPDQMALMFRHGLSKAMAMGIPFMVSQPELIADHAKELGCEVLDNSAVRLWVDQGHTGMHHNQGMEQADYFIGWPPIHTSQTTIRPANPEDTRVERNYQMGVIIPPRAA